MRSSLLRMTIPVAKLVLFSGKLGYILPDYTKINHGLYVDLFVPSEVTWNQGGEEVKIVQTTAYPESETTSLAIQTKKRARFSLRLRVPGWGQGATLELNGAKLDVACRPGAWAKVERDWDPGDRVAFRIPMQLKLTPVDKRHPNLIALAYGPVVLVQSQESSSLPVPSDFSKWLVPGERPLAFRSEWKTKGIFEPFYRTKFGIPYRMYFRV